MMLSLPQFHLARGEPARRLVARGIVDFHAAARYIHSLPYGRNTDPAEFTRVLDERRGTCSTKHALLAAIARAHHIDVHLRLGIYWMDELNTPGVGAPLEAHGLSKLPEAHCFLVADGRRVDLTFPDTDGDCALHFVAERDIAPEDIGQPKQAYHRMFIEHWARSEGLDPRAAWDAREACIAALSASQ